MEHIKNFYELEVWKKAHGLTIEIYKITKQFPQDELFGITSQLRRAMSSVGANIAEGFGRYHFKDKTRFYYQARGSAEEVQNFLFLAKDLEYISAEVCHNFIKQVQEIEKYLNGLITSVGSGAQVS